MVNLDKFTGVFFNFSTKLQNALVPVAKQCHDGRCQPVGGREHGVDGGQGGVAGPAEAVHVAAGVGGLGRGQHRGLDVAHGLAQVALIRTTKRGFDMR